MRLFLVGFAFLVAVTTGTPEQQDSLAVLEEIETLKPTIVSDQDGYRYKTIRRFRHRRDVDEAQYLPPVQNLGLPEPGNEYLSPIEGEEPLGELADDGYRYKTVKRLRYRNRRDVSELSSNDYLPPVQVSNEGYSYPAPAPVQVAAPPPVAEQIQLPVDIPAPVPVEPSAELASDGYRYKTVRRIRYRIRRDVNEVPSEYIPPVQALSLSEPNNQYLAPIESIEQLADDGYRYKTLKRLRHRHRRDVNELASADYLPPVQEESGYSYPAPTPIQVPAPVEIEAPVEIPAHVEDSAVLANDGYRYKTVRRIRYRHRRDVNELPADYLPPAEDLSLAEPNNQYLAPIESTQPISSLEPELVNDEPIQETAELADDGYRYKTVKRLRYRNRRDVSELAAADYLPPIKQEQPEPGYSYPAPAPVEVSVPAPAPVSAPIELPTPVEVTAPIEVPAPVIPTVELANDGYRYKTVRRIRYRHRRDVNELLSGEYLPPGQEVALAEPSNEYLAPTGVLDQPIEQIAEDGYRYKTVKKYKIKRH